MTVIVSKASTIQYDVSQALAYLDRFKPLRKHLWSDTEVSLCQCQDLHLLAISMGMTKTLTLHENATANSAFKLEAVDHWQWNDWQRRGYLEFHEDIAVYDSNYSFIGIMIDQLWYHDSIPQLVVVN